MIDKKILRKQLKFYRNKAGYTQAQLADAINTSKNWISQIETTDRMVSFRMLLDICIVLRVPVKYLLSDREEYRGQDFLKKLDKLDKRQINILFNFLERYKNDY